MDTFTKKNRWKCFFWTKKAYSTRDDVGTQDQGASEWPVDKEKGAIMSMSCKDTPADNARMNYHI